MLPELGIFGFLGGKSNTRTPQSTGDIRALQPTQPCPVKRAKHRAGTCHTHKSVMAGYTKDLKYAVCSMQGWRISMEDAHCMIPEVGSSGVSVFGVFDGHGGADVSKRCAEKLPGLLEEHALYDNEEPTAEDVEGALMVSLSSLEEEIVQASLEGGSTACVVAVSASFVVVANVGDSRCVASVGRVCTPLSEDHKPVNRSEYRRIHKAGGYVTKGRVNGTLAVSRAMGDLAYKRSDPDSEGQMVIATPDFRSISRENVDFVFVACDGVWDVLSNEELVQFVLEKLDGGKDPSSITKSVARRCTAKTQTSKGGKDNITAFLIVPTGETSYSDTSAESTDDSSDTSTTADVSSDLSPTWSQYSPTTSPRMLYSPKLSPRLLYSAEGSPRMRRHSDSFLPSWMSDGELSLGDTSRDTSSDSDSSVVTNGSD